VEYDDFEIDWHGNDGRSFPRPGELQTVKCGICGAQMEVKRNVLGPTGLVESLSRKKHWHDSFICLNIEKWWHKIIHQLKVAVYVAEINQDADFEKIKKAAKEQILEILNSHNKVY